MSNVTPIWRGSQTIEGKLANLPIIDEVDEMIREGLSAGDIAHYLHDTFEVLTEFPHKKVVDAINNRAKALPPLPGEWPAAHSPGKYDDGREPGSLSKAQYRRACQGVDKLLELESLYLSQRDRIDRKIRRENESGDFYDNMPSEYREAREMIREIATVERDFGGSMNRMRMSLEIQGASDTDLGKKIAGVMENPESRHKVISMFKRMASAAQLPAALETDPPGSS